MASSFSFDMSSLEKGLAGLEDKVETALRMYAENAALKLQNYSRDNAPWTDRTGNARQRLTGTVARLSDGWEITLAHGVDYGVWLELAHEKNFAIIHPTIRMKSEEIMRGFERLLERLG